MIQKGETILTEQPFAFILKSTLRNEKCDNCFSPTELKKCSRCQYVYYCSKNCQKLSWPLHKLECKNLNKIFPKIVPDSAHLLIRIILRLKLCENNECSYSMKRPFQDLMSHCSEIREDKRRMEHFTSLLIVLRSFFDYEMAPDSLIFELFGKMCINSFNILDNDMNSIGTGIYLDASVLDHSCEPNAVAIFEGTTLLIRSIKNIPNFQLKKVKISYIDVLNLPEHRKKELQSMYYFVCDCERCRFEVNDYSMNLMVCMNTKCDAYVPITENSETKYVCNGCNSNFEKNKIQEFNDIIHMSDYYLQNMKKGDAADIDVYETILRRQKGVLHELNIRRIKILDLAFEACINLQRWSKAIEYGIQLRLGFRKYYGLFHPLTGLINVKLLKLVLLMSDLDQARIFYEEANQILSITHGTTHSLHKSLRELCSDQL